MPGRFMDDGMDPDLFDHFAIVARRTGVYTVRDYAGIIEHLVTACDIAGRSVSGEAARAQEELCWQAERYARLADRTAAAMAKQPARAFSWITADLFSRTRSLNSSIDRVARRILLDHVPFDGGPHQHIQDRQHVVHLFGDLVPSAPLKFCTSSVVIAASALSPNAQIFEAGKLLASRKLMQVSVRLTS